jgi:hypothetical protein
MSAPTRLTSGRPDVPWCVFLPRKIIIMVVPTRTLGVTLVVILCALAQWVLTAPPVFDPSSYRAGVEYMRSQPPALRDATLTDCKIYAADGMAEAHGYSWPSFVGGCYEVALNGE